MPTGSRARLLNRISGSGEKCSPVGTFVADAQSHQKIIKFIKKDND